MPDADTPEHLSALRGAGWAPGNYIVVCLDCGPGDGGPENRRHPRDWRMGDKRCSRCRPCAEKVVAADDLSVFPDLGDDPEARAADTADRLGEMRAERDAAVTARRACRERLQRSYERFCRMRARAETAEATASEHSAYRTAAAAFLASEGLLGEYDAWCERGGLPADTVGRLVAVARAAPG